MSTQIEAAATLPSHQSKRKKKKRKKSATAVANNDDGDVDSILQSKLSLKKQLNLKNACKQTPWYDTNELIQTGRALLLSLKLFPTHHHQQHQYTPPGLTPDEHAQLKLAFRRVAVWRGHAARGRLSHAVEVTAGLAGLLLSDAERAYDNNAAANNTPYQLRSSYSTLLLRSVNGLADTYRHQRKSSLLSVSHCCALAGLPLWIVDIRHDASHNDLPSLGLCRIGAIESLRFWKTRYWDTLEKKVWGMKSEIGALNPALESDDVGICTFALDCLVRYQQAALLEAKERESAERNQKSKTRTDIRRKVEQEVVGSEKPDHDMDDLLLLPDEPKQVVPKPKRDLTADSTNPFAILHDEKPKKKKSKENPKQNSISGKDSADIIESEPNNEDSAKAQPNKSQASPRDCAAEFVREVPMDIAMSECLKFLVWGIGAEELRIHQGPAILTCHSELSLTQDGIDYTFNNLRAIYDPLLIAITNAYPGFVAALVVHLMDSILCLDSERGSLDTFENHSTNDSELFSRQLSCNIHYLSMWVRYLFSREFHMHFNRSAAIYVAELKSVVVKTDTGETREFQSNPIDLKKKGRKNWTPQQLIFMQSSLEYTIFQSLGMPINSICDRLVTHRDKHFRNCDDAVSKLLHFFEGILGEKRVAFMGLEERREMEGTNEACVADTIEGETSIPDADKSVALPSETSPITSLTSKDMSLEDIEAFLSKPCEDKPSEDQFTDKGTNGVHDSALDHHTKKPTIKAWTLCKTWDPCAIGSMPGYPA